jgi:hypothetical protein
LTGFDGFVGLMDFDTWAGADDFAFDSVEVLAERLFDSFEDLASLTGRTDFDLLPWLSFRPPDTGFVGRLAFAALLGFCEFFDLFPLVAGRPSELGLTGRDPFPDRASRLPFEGFVSFTSRAVCEPFFVGAGFELLPLVLPDLLPEPFFELERLELEEEDPPFDLEPDPVTEPAMWDPRLMERCSSTCSWKARAGAGMDYRLAGLAVLVIPLRSPCGLPLLGCRCPWTRDLIRTLMRRLPGSKKGSWPWPCQASHAHAIP